MRSVKSGVAARTVCGLLVMSAVLMAGALSPSTAVAAVTVIGREGTQFDPIPFMGGILFSENRWGGDVNALDMGRFTSRSAAPAFSPVDERPGSQAFPDADGTIAVYAYHHVKEGADQYAIRVFYGANGSVLDLDVGTVPVDRPTIQGTRVAWQRYVAGENRDIVQVELDANGDGRPDFAQGTTALPVANIVVSGPSDQFNPELATWGLAWVESTGGGLFEVRVKPSDGATVPASLGGATRHSEPSSAGDLLVWHQTISVGGEQVCIYDRRTGATTTIPPPAAGHFLQYPTTDGERVAWVQKSSFFDVGQVYARLQSGEIRHVSPTSSLQLQPRFGEGHLVWQDGRQSPGTPDVAFVSVASIETALLTRLWGPDRYATAVRIAREAYPGFAGVSFAGVRHVVIASGEDRSAVDALAAAGLCGVFDAPLLLVRSGGVPPVVLSALSSMPAGVKVIVVGGTTAVSPGVVSALSQIRTVESVERVWGTNRFETARAVATRMRAELARQGKPMPKTALLANGADPAAFTDALALSAISASENFPILLLGRDAVPAPTAAALAEHGLTARIIGGGPAVVSERVRTALGAERWSGRTRHETAIAIADGAISRVWLDRRSAGVAARLPDALTGGAFMGSRRGALLLTGTSSLTPVTGAWLAAHREQIGSAYIFGGTSSVGSVVETQIGDALR